MEKKWEEMSADERREVLFQRWLSPPGIEFASPEAEKAYKERVTRIKDAVKLEKTPDRVPIWPFTGFFPAFYAGITLEKAMYDYDKQYAAWKKYVMDFEPDAHGSLLVPTPGKCLEILDYKVYSWPGHGVSSNRTYQCYEREWMNADEYDAFIQDPSGFAWNVYLPRIFGALEPFNKLPLFTSVVEIYGGFLGAYLIQYGLPDVQAAFKALLEAGSEALKWGGYVLRYHKEMAESGFPLFFGGGCKAPFDFFADTLRGITRIMVDMYRQPDKLLEAMEVVTPLMIKMGAGGAKANGIPIVFIPLHNGADGFMSDEQFKKFYWPTLRKVIMGLIDEGCVPLPFAEGSYNTRLEVIREGLPKGKTAWLFDRTDMTKAKAILGDVACIAGNVPSPLLATGTPQEVEDYIKKLIDTAGKGGGYIVVNGVVMDEAKPENLKAMIEATKEYGVYK